jgi:hypothetical protein
MKKLFKLQTWFLLVLLPNIALFSQQQTDLIYVPLATNDEITEFNRLKSEQEGVGILAGGTTKPIYYHHNKPGGILGSNSEYTYKYKKQSTVGEVDTWHPVSEFRITVCGTLTKYDICPANFLHKYLTQDRDFNFYIKPNPPFNFCLNNRWYKGIHGKDKIYTEIEGEVNALDLDLDLSNPNKAFENKYSTTNPIFDAKNGKIKQMEGKNMCIYGPWMLDDLHTSHIDYNNNEIHPINQFWFRDANGELNLTTIVDGETNFNKEGKGYDGKQPNYEWPASGIREYAQFHIAFEIKPTEFKDFTLYGSGYDTPMPTASTQYAIPQILTWRGREAIKVSPVYENGKKCYTVSFDKVRKRNDGTVQGYIVVQTEAITKGRGSVTVRYKQSGFRDDKYFRTIGDANGDGKVDLVGFGQQATYLAYSNTNGFENPKFINDFSLENGIWEVDKHVRTIGDVNGDGKGDIIGFGQKGVYVAFSNGSGFEPAKFVLADFAIGNGAWSVERHERTVGDVNGDGKDDIIGFGQKGVYVAFSNGSGFEPAKFVLADFAIEAFGWQVDKHVRTVGDVNGDGKIDIIGFGQTGVHVAFSNGSGFEPAKFVLADFAIDKFGWQVGNHVRTVGDVNGDGKSDIVGFGQKGVYVAFSTGSGFEASKFVLADFSMDNGAWRVGTHVRTMGDVNGDGKDDIIGFGQKGVYVAFSTGSGFEASKFVLANFAVESGGW